MGVLIPPIPESERTSSRGSSRTSVGGVGGSALAGSRALAKVAAAGLRLDRAATQCCKEVDEVARKKKSRKPHNLPRWFEIEHRCIDYLHSQLPRAHIALQLSEVHGQYDGLAPVMSVAEARHLHTELAMGPGRGVDALRSLGNETVVWALPEAEAWQRMLAAYSKFAATSIGPSKFPFIIPLDIPGYCDMYRDITGTYGHIH